MTPWELAKDSEHSHQRALFAWANCAALYGFDVANDPRGYTLVERNSLLSEGRKLSPPREKLARLLAVHNQGHGNAIRGARAKAEGVKAGVPDILLPVVRYQQEKSGKIIPAFGFWVELKRPGLKPVRLASKGATSAKQNDWIEYLRLQGYATAVAYGWQEAASAIQLYMDGHFYA